MSQAAAAAGAAAEGSSPAAVNAIMWFRQDLRIHDNPALVEAAKWAQRRGGSVVCVYVHSPTEDGDAVGEGSRCEGIGRSCTSSSSSASCLLLWLASRQGLRLAGTHEGSHGLHTAAGGRLSLSWDKCLRGNVADHHQLAVSTNPLSFDGPVQQMTVGSVKHCSRMLLHWNCPVCSWRPGCASLLWMQCALQSLSTDLVARYGAGAGIVFKQGPYVQALSEVGGVVVVGGGCW